MSSVDQYISAATRDSTRRSYRSAIEHFESEWGGFLPATADAIARYLSDYAHSLSVNTLRQRLAAIAQWHADQGFPDPTKNPMVKKVVRGIRTLHPPKPKQAKPLALTQLEQIDTWLEHQISTAEAKGDLTAQLKGCRDRAIVLLGFWRGFRSDELSRLTIEDITLAPGEGMSIYLPQTKTRELGVSFRAPVLSRLCPVSAYQQWIAVAHLTKGPVFRSIDRWGHIGRAALKPLSYVKLLRTLFKDAGITDAIDYSSHSLRRGFATWASASGWSLKAMMEYVGWKDVGSALRYIDAPDPYGQHRIEQQLQQLPTPSTARTGGATVLLELVFTLESYQIKKRGMELARDAIETCCLKPFNANPIKRKQGGYTLAVSYSSEDQLNEIIDLLLDDMHQLAASRQCFLIATISDPTSDRAWE